MDTQHIRNFCIIAHIDHGKSTLADRLLEMTHTVSPLKMHSQFLDSMDLEREKGITIKLKAVRMLFEYEGLPYTFNLIDTPGHVDFSYEVSRSLAACEGALLLVDATQGVQAQTLANFYAAFDQGLDIIPVINKIDMPNADIGNVTKDLTENLGFKKEEILLISAKEGTNINTIFPEIINQISPPKGDPQSPFRALIFDSAYDQHKGVVLYVRVIDGTIGKGQRIRLMATNVESDILDVGYLTPEFHSFPTLGSGEVGYIATGLKDLSHCQVGDTVIKTEENKDPYHIITPLPGYRPIQPMVFLGLYPIDSGDFLKLKEALLKIHLTDASLEFAPETSPALGNGYRCGFLGLLHAEIIQERLEREYDLELISTVPNVEYEIIKKASKEIENIKTPFELPDPSIITELREPWVKLTIFSPKQYLGGIMQLCEGKRGTYINVEYIGQRVKMLYEIPLAELIIDFYDSLKSITSGYASMDYEFIEFRQVEAVKLDIMVAGDKIDAFAQIVVRSQAESRGRQVVKKLKDVIPRQQFKVALQATIGGKIVAREDLASYRKDVTAKLYGGDVTRKMKLLEKQKKGKARMKKIGKVDIPQEAFLAILKKGD